MSKPFIPYGEPRCGQCDSRSLKYEYTLGGQFIIFCDFCKTTPDTLSFPSYDYQENPSTFACQRCTHCKKILPLETVSTLCSHCLIKINEIMEKIKFVDEYTSPKPIKVIEEKPKSKKPSRRKIILD